MIPGVILSLLKPWGKWVRSRRIEQGVRTCLGFYVSGMLFGVDTRAVQEIARFNILAEPRGMPRCIRGLFRHKGLMIPVIDLAQRFGHAKLEPGGRTCIVIVELGLERWRKEIGLMVDEVRGLSELAVGAIKPMPEALSKQVLDQVEGVCRLEKDYLVVLDHLRLLTDTEAAEVSDFLKTLGSGAQRGA